MIKFTATSAAYIGEVVIIYGDDGRLLTINFMPGELTVEQTEWLKNNIPARYDMKTFMPTFAGTGLEIIESGFDVSFDMFWVKYKQKINRQRCEKIWAKLGNADRQRAYFGITAYFNHLALNTWKSKADPETYLKNKYWLNQWK